MPRTGHGRRAKRLAKQPIKHVKKHTARQQIPHAEHPTLPFLSCATMSCRRRRRRPPPRGLQGWKPRPPQLFAPAAARLRRHWPRAHLPPVCAQGCVRAVSPCKRVCVEGKRAVRRGQACGAGNRPLLTDNRVMSEARATKACQARGVRVSRGWARVPRQALQARRQSLGESRMRESGLSDAREWVTDRSMASRRRLRVCTTLLGLLFRV